MPTKRKTTNWIVWISLLGVLIVCGYFICGLFLFEDLSLDKLESYLAYIFLHPFRSWWNRYSPYGILTALMVWVIAFSAYLSNNKNYMFGREFGSAKWADINRFNRQLADYNGKKTAKNLTRCNRILSQHARISYHSDKTLLNNNQIIVGGSGAGKTAFQIAPNLFQRFGCNVYTDPKGNLLADYGKYLIAHGIRVKCNRLKDFRSIFLRLAARAKTGANLSSRAARADKRRKKIKKIQPDTLEMGLRGRPAGA